MRRKLVFFLVFSILLITGSSATIYSSYVIPSTGTVKTVGVEVYWDSECTQKITSINWGMTEPGGTKKEIIYVKNTGNSPITLTLSMSNWNPLYAKLYIGLSWNFTGVLFDVSPVELLLSISSNVNFTNFSFDITIIGAS